MTVAALWLILAVLAQDTRTKVLPSANKSIARYDAGQIDVRGGEVSNGSNLDSLRNIGQIVEFPIIAPPKLPKKEGELSPVNVADVY
eukprot:1161628-Pelagomonas_calceolata.AAC.22